MESLLAALMARITGVAGVPADLYAGQYLDDQSHPLRLPGALVEAASVEWRADDQGSQQGALRLVVHVVQELYGDFAAHSPEQGASLAVFRLPDAVNAAVQGWAGAQRQRTEYEQVGALHVAKLSYQLAVWEAVPPVVAYAEWVLKEQIIKQRL